MDEDIPYLMPTLVPTQRVEGGLTLIIISLMPTHVPTQRVEGGLT